MSSLDSLGYIDTLPDDPWVALGLVCSKFYNIVNEARNTEHGWDLNYYSAYIEHLALATVIISNNNLKIDAERPIISGDARQNMSDIADYFSVLNQNATKHGTDFHLAQSIEAINVRLGAGFYYEFSDDDIGKIQNLINELRDLITKSDVLEEDYKSRLLNRLERLQSELHKKVSDLDRFWGLVGDAGVMAGKFGEDVKPIVDRIMELGKIIWGAQAKAEELPPATEFPLLTKEDDN